MDESKHIPTVTTVCSTTPGKSLPVQTSYLTQEKKIKLEFIKNFINSYSY